MSVALVRSPRSMAWELRSAWAAGWRVALSLDQRCSRPRVEGIVSRVSATDAWVVVAGLRVPFDAVLAVHRPSRLGDSTARIRWSGAPRTRPQVEEIPGVAG